MNKKWTAEMQAKAESMAANGCSLCEMGRLLGVNYKTVQRHLSQDANDQNQARARAWGDANPERRVWRDMLRCCCSPAFHSYPRYGGRGITVCDRWKESFDAFFEDVGPRPSRGYSINRIDGRGNFEPGNVRWATPKEVARNIPTNVWVEFNGERMVLAEAAERLGGNRAMTRYHVDKGTHPLIRKVEP